MVFSNTAKKPKHCGRMSFLDYTHITYLWARREAFELSLVSCEPFLAHCVSLSLTSSHPCLPFLLDELIHLPGQAAASWSVGASSAKC